MNESMKKSLKFDKLFVVIIESEISQQKKLLFRFQTSQMKS